MPKYTENYKLILPEQSENYDVDIANTNNKEIDTQLGNKVDKIAGKGLSTNDFTNEYKNKLDRLKNYDDSLLQTEIEKLKTEDKNFKQEQKEQNTNIDKLKEENKQLKDYIENITKALPNGEAEGKNIHLEDSAEAELLDIKAYGESEQETRSGKNIINAINATKQEINGVTFTPVFSNGDLQYINVNGTATDRADYIFTDYFDVEANKYIISKGVKAYDPFLLLIEKGGFALANVGASAGNDSEIITITETKSVRVFIRVSAEQVINNVKIYPMIRMSNIEDDTYEPSGAMPSPEHPSKIHNIGDNVTNEFNSEDWYNTLHAISSTDMQKEIVDGVEYYKIKPGLFYTYQYMKGKFKENTQYTISCKARQYNQIEHSGTGFMFHYTDGTDSLEHIKTTLTEYNYKIVSKKGKTIDYIGPSYSYNEFALVRDIKLEEGTEATPYIPYGCGNITIKVANKNLDEEVREEQTATFTFAEGQVLHKDDYLADDGIHHVRKTIEFDGSEDEEWIYNVFGGANRISINIPDAKIYTNSENNGQLSSHFNYNKSSALTEAAIHQIGTFAQNKNTKNFYFIVNQTSLVDFKSCLSNNPIKLEYELEEEIIEPYSEEQQEAWNNIKKLMTYKNITNIYSDAYLKIVYLKDLNKILQP